MYLKQGKLKLRFPILPNEFTISDGNNNTTVNLVGKRGDINFTGNRQLRTITLSGTFPKDKNHVKGKQYSKIPTAHRCVQIIMEMLRENGGVVYFLATSVTKGHFTIESFEHSIGQGGHYTYSLSLKLYVKPKLKLKRKKGSKKVTSKITKYDGKRQSKQLKTVTVIVKKGDTLSAIAKKYTGSASNYLAIAKQNNISNPNKLKIGQKLVIKP